MMDHYEVVKQDESAEGPEVIFVPQGVAGNLPGDEILLHVAIERYERLNELVDVINEVLIEEFGEKIEEVDADDYS